MFLYLFDQSVGLDQVAKASFRVLLDQINHSLFKSVVQLLNRYMVLQPPA